MPEPTQIAAPVTNSEFLRALAGGAANGTTTWVTAFKGSPDLTDASNWAGRPYNAATMGGIVDSWAGQNAYFSVAALRPAADGEIRRRKANFSRLLALVADDVFIEDIRGQVSYVLATSPGKHQVGVFIDGRDQDAANLELVGRLVTTMADRGMLRADISGNNAVRYVRLPLGENQKPRESGAFQVRLDRWVPRVSLALADAAAAFGVDLDELRGEVVQRQESRSLTAAAGQDERLRLLTASILRGDDLHDSTNKVAASLVASGMPGGAIVNLLRALMEASHAAKDERWLARYQDISRCVSTAEEKFKREIVAKPTDDSGEKPEDDALPLLTLAELQAKAAQISWLVKGAVPLESLGVMFGASGTFKSFVALDMALHIAHGMPWMGRKTKQAPVIFIAAEGGAGLWRRIEAWHRERGINWQDAPIYVLPMAVDLGVDCSRVVTAAKAIGVTPGLVVVDTLSQTFSGEENSSTEVSKYLRELGLWFRESWQCAVLVIHHTGHMAAERPRGSSAIRANVDFMLGVHRDEKEMLATVSFHKQKDGELLKDQLFAMSVFELGLDDDGDAITALVARAVASEDERQHLIQHEAATGRSGRNAQLLGLAQNGMRESELRKVFYDACDLGDADARRQAYYRALNWAKKAGLIEIAQGHVLILAPAKARHEA